MSAALDLEWGRNGKVALLGEVVGVDKGLEVIHYGFGRRGALPMGFPIERLRWQGVRDFLVQRIA